jgi:lysophospholipase L1-like esterase
LTFLRAHPGEVSPVTLTIGTNDIPGLLGPCTVDGQIDVNCVRQNAPSFIASLVGRISTVLHALRSAAPNAEIIVTGAWDPFVTDLAFADPLYQSFNTSFEATAAADRVRFADPLPIFTPQGDLSREVQAICTLSLLCRDGDSHPSDAGYRALAGLVFDASDYIRLASH